MEVTSRPPHTLLLKLRAAGSLTRVAAADGSLLVRILASKRRLYLPTPKYLTWEARFIAAEDKTFHKHLGRRTQKGLSAPAWFTFRFAAHSVRFDHHTAVAKNFFC